MTARPAFQRKDPKSKQSGQTRTYILRPPLTLRETELPSVTSILGALPKPALKLWGEKIVAEAATEHRDMLIKMQPDDMTKWLRGAPDRIMRQRGNRGTNIHTVAENVLNGTHPETNKSPWAAHVKTFADAWIDEVITVEQVCISLADGWAGTTDFIFRNKQGEVCLADWKSSKDVYPDNALQLAAYACADTWVMNPHTDKPVLAKPIHIDRIAILHVTDEGVKYYEPDYTIEHLYRVFLATELVWRSLRNSPTKIKLWQYDEAPMVLERALEASLEQRGEPVPRPRVEDYVQHLRARCLHAQSEQPHFKTVLAGRWPEGMPGLASGEIDNVKWCEQIDKIITSVERDLEISFGHVPAFETGVEPDDVLAETEARQDAFDAWAAGS